MSNRLNQEREKELQPIRMDQAISEIEFLGYEIDFRNDTMIEFIFKGETVKFFPYSGWHTGKSINDGRGLANLFKQIRK